MFVVSLCTRVFVVVLRFCALFPGGGGGDSAFDCGIPWISFHCFLKEGCKALLGRVMKKKLFSRLMAKLSILPKLSGSIVMVLRPRHGILRKVFRSCSGLPSTRSKNKLHVTDNFCIRQA